MKKTLLNSAVLATSLLGALGSASAETVHARIPFGFLAAGTSMPAGAYEIHTMANAPTVLVFENEDTKATTIVFARVADIAAAKTAVPLTFASDSKDLMELTHIATDGHSYELSIQPVRKLTKSVVLTLHSSSK